MGIHELAGKKAPSSILANIPRLVTAYYVQQTGTHPIQVSGLLSVPPPRGSSLRNSFNEITYSQSTRPSMNTGGLKGSQDPFPGHGHAALFRTCADTALEYLQAGVVRYSFSKRLRYTPTPVHLPRRSFCYNGGRTEGLCRPAS